jgi:transposase-like protein
MVNVREMQLRLVYSLLKPAVRAAARFGIPIRTLGELLRLAYFEQLSRSGLSVGEIAKRFGQTPRHMRSLAQRLKEDFFRAERDVGLAREVEALVAERTPSEEELAAALASWDPAEVRAAIAELVAEERIERDADGRLHMAKQYVVLRSDEFHHRIDSLNHLLDGTYRAVLHRLVFDDRETAMMKTISFSALPAELVGFLRRLEGELRRELAALDESATYQGQAEQRFTIALTLAPAGEEKKGDV